MTASAASRRTTATESTGRPKGVRAQRLANTSDAILASALDHFSRVGFAQASLRDIAADAGVQHGMIRHIYKTKEELWRRALAFLFERMEREMPRNIVESEPSGEREGFETWIHWYVGYCARHPEHARLMIQQSILEGPEVEWASEHFVRARHMAHRPFIQALQRAGHLPDVDPLSLYVSVTAACQIPYLLAPEIKAVSGRDPYSPAAIEAHANAVIGIFLR